MVNDMTMHVLSQIVQNIWTRVAMASAFLNSFFVMAQATAWMELMKWNNAVVRGFIRATFSVRCMTLLNFSL